MDWRNSLLFFEFLILTFLLGLYFMTNYNVITPINEEKENFNNMGMDNTFTACPDVLLQVGAKFYLYNKDQKQTPGINPIIFDSLEEYTKFIDWQRSKGIKCPILYVQKSFGAQGVPELKIRSSPNEPDGGTPPALTTDDVGKRRLLIDATRDDMPFNKDMYPGIDPLNLDIGKITPIDDIGREKETEWVLSDDPMDSNWGGPAYSTRIVETDYYSDNYVYKVFDRNAPLPEKNKKV